MLVTVLIQAGHGNISLDQVQWMIDHPLDAVLSGVIELFPPSPAYALYLTGVEYKPDGILILLF